MGAGMRISITLDPERGILRLPVHYHHLIQGMIYSGLDKALAQWLHGEGFRHGKRHFKLFTFSRLLSRKRSFDPLTRFIEFHGRVTLKIGAMDSQVLESLVLHLVREPEVILNETLCRLLSVEVEIPPQVQGPVRVRALSPITVYSTLFTAEGKKKVYYYCPWEEDFSQKVLENLRRKAQAYYGKGEGLPSLDGSYIKPLKVSKRNEAIVNFKGTWVKGWMGLYELSLPEPFFTLAYNAGLGSKNSQGFGMVEVVRDAETRR